MGPAVPGPRQRTIQDTDARFVEDGRGRVAVGTRVRRGDYAPAGDRSSFQLRTYQTAMPIAGRSAISQKIPSQLPPFIQPVHGPMARSSRKLTSDHEPDAMPVIIAACSRGNAYEPTLSATIWKPPPMNVDRPMSVIASGTDAVIVTNP